MALIACQYDEYIGIEELTPWPVLLAAVLLSIGFSMIFKKRRRVIHDGSSVVFDSVDIDEEDGNTICVKNTFSETSKYVNSNDFTSGDIKNTFGETRVYFNNAVLANGRATLYVDNTFGETCIYIPRTWRLDLKKNNSFGDIAVRGNGNNDMDAPLITIDAKNSFGEICIVFE